MIKKVKTQTLYEQVEEQIRNMILKGIYKKGDLLPSEKELIEMTGVSRITVREALRGLSEVGIIETHKGKGSIVRIDENELMTYIGKEEVLNYRRNFELATETRLLIEPEIAKKAALLATEEDIAYLEECLLQQNRKKGKSNDVEGSLENFHRGILKILNNPILTDLFDSLTKLESDENYIKLVPPGRQDTVSRELDTQHYKILQSIKERNEEFAYFYMKEHMQYLKSIYTKYFDNFFDIR
ncbi:FadR/GntR family transcriptional regulator [Clostridium malenominatum]|uniref:FadR/GntR family transcriptional regulator n=1 Tax=Clostridium malenominatum TaxID=1539 RepID=A0ABN1IS02_9CLOT